jgi:hypothetical protein
LCLDHSDADFLLAAREEVIQRPVRRVAGLEDRLDAGRRVALTPKELGCRRQDPFLGAASTFHRRLHDPILPLDRSIY